MIFPNEWGWPLLSETLHWPMIYLLKQAFHTIANKTFAANTCPFQIRTVVGSYTSFSKITKRWGGGGALHNLEERSAQLLTWQPTWQWASYCLQRNTDFQWALTATGNTTGLCRQPPGHTRTYSKAVSYQHLFLQLHPPPLYLTFEERCLSFAFLGRSSWGVAGEGMKTHTLLLYQKLRLLFFLLTILREQNAKSYSILCA